MQLLLGQKLSSNINLLAQLFILIGLWIGFYFARKKQFSTHRKIQTSLVLINSFFILFVMVTSFYNYVILGGTTTGRVASSMIMHGIFGLLAELTGIYLILRMNTNLIPERLRVSNYKLVMRLLLGLWTLVAFGGFAIYYVRYLVPSPSTTGLPSAQLLQASDGLQMHAGEMQDALTRGNLTTARRHAEHLINLAEGKQGPDYGDADGDGVVEDPGDGTGALVYLERVLAAPGQPASNKDQAVQIAGEVRGRMLKIVEDARAVVQASDLQSAAGSIREAVDLSQQIKNGSTGNVAQLLEALNQSASPSTVVETTSPSGGQAVVVNMKDFAFDPKLLKVKAGTTVIFVNQDPEKHTVTSDTGLFDSGDILPGKSFSYTFLQAGTFPYFCVFHGDKGGVDMAGSVVVDP